MHTIPSPYGPCHSSTHSVSDPMCLFAFCFSLEGMLTQLSIFSKQFSAEINSCHLPTPNSKSNSVHSLICKSTLRSDPIQACPNALRSYT